MCWFLASIIAMRNPVVFWFLIFFPLLGYFQDLIFVPDILKYYDNLSPRACFLCCTGYAESHFNLEIRIFFSSGRFSLILKFYPNRLFPLPSAAPSFLILSLWNSYYYLCVELTDWWVLYFYHLMYFSFYFLVSVLLSGRCLELHLQILLISFICSLSNF